MNFAYADRAGNIGYQAAGRIPIRGDGKTPVLSDAPLDGASGQAEWSGYVPFEQMPNILNPPSGVIATANQDPFPPGFPFQADGSYADRYRVEQIRALLTSKAKLSVDDMLAVQKDVYSAYDRFLAQQVVAAFARKPSSDALTREAIQILRGWNGQMDKDQPAPAITQLLSNRLQRMLVAQLQPAANAAAQDNFESGERSGGVLAAEKAIPDILPRSQLVEQFLRSRPAGWVPNNDWNGWLRTNFEWVVEAGRRQQGSPVAKWRWGRILQWKFAHPIGKNLPLVDGFFDIGPVEMSGSGTTVKQTTGTLGPSERMVVDLGDLEKSVQNLPTGESGFVGSAHYKDQWPAYYVGKSFPMQFNHIDAKEVLQVRPN
jgi:penicillin G amidase